ncbi:MAG TPA: glycosyltransferase [Dictyobacter sp.]|jgi:chlorobactene glucosyltransferase|nr:glycosyltransferase [Dictyobacter sp.]
MMEKQYWWQAWPRFLLWSHAISVAGFYLIQWQRTYPDKKDRVIPLPVQKVSSTEAVTDGTNPPVSVIVPARNEEHNIRRCVTSLLEQDYDNYEVIVVDDESTDGTGHILDELIQTHPRGNLLWVLRLRELPENWAGKTHAIHRGVQEANGDWLLFTDADTWHAPNAIRSSVTQAVQEQADLFTLGSKQELPTFWERVMMPMAYLGISMLYPPRKVNDPTSPLAIANGQYILIRRQAYEEIGGYAHPALRKTVLDDRDLAQVVKDHGYRLRFVDGRDLVSVRMYQGFADLWRGWRKNAYLGNRGGAGFVLLELAGLPMITIVPFLLPFLGQRIATKAHVFPTRKEARLAALFELLPLLAYRSWLNRSMDVPWYYAFTHPLAGVLFEGILGQSMWRVLSKRGVDWRGRMYHNDL